MPGTLLEADNIQERLDNAEMNKEEPDPITMCEFCESEDAALFCSYLRMYVCVNCHEYEKYQDDDHFFCTSDQQQEEVQK